MVKNPAAPISTYHVQRGLSDVATSDLSQGSARLDFDVAPSQNLRDEELSEHSYFYLHSLGCAWGKLVAEEAEDISDKELTRCLRSCVSDLYSIAKYAKQRGHLIFKSELLQR